MMNEKLSKITASSNCVKIYTDGAFRGSPKRGGWAFLILAPFLILGKSGHKDQTTNNEMELFGILEGLRNLPFNSYPVEVFSDSQYAVNSMMVWWENWSKAKFITSTGSKVKNLEILLDIKDWQLKHNATLSWVRGHDGNLCNELVDAFAVKSAEYRKPFEFIKVEG